MARCECKNETSKRKDLQNNVVTVSGFGAFPQHWQEAVLTMLPKGGDPLDTNNWRPIAILDITYKIFARILYQRIQLVLEPEQSDAQMGFRPRRGVDHALCILELVLGASLEWNLPVYIVSIDLSKAFDRVQYKALFASLAEQGLPDVYIAFLSSLYDGQRGLLEGALPFAIQRGVRQGDVLSPLLFNAALESVMRRWLRRLENRYGILLREGNSTHRLTDVRYADDLLLFARSAHEAMLMLEALQMELAVAGLSINASKTKVFTTDPVVMNSEEPVTLQSGSITVEVLHKNGSHKYLGKMLNGDLRQRSSRNLSHRLQCGWLKFHNLQPTLLNRKIPVHLRLKLFDTCVSPTVVYSLSSTALTQSQLHKLDATQRIMMRRIIGWQHFDEETWEQTGHRMKLKLQLALRKTPVRNWSLVREDRQRALVMSIHNGTCPVLLQDAFHWEPATCYEQARRSRGRPRTRLFL